MFYSLSRNKEKVMIGASSVKALQLYLYVSRIESKITICFENFG